jgi:hypothetical protein
MIPLGGGGGGGGGFSLPLDPSMFAGPGQVCAFAEKQLLCCSF